MIDLAALAGSEVKDGAGADGRLGISSPTEIKIQWGSTPFDRREAVYPRAEWPKLEGVHILTLNAGWVPLSPLLAVESVGKRPMIALCEDLTAIAEKSDHFPFKNQDSIGPGPNQSFGTRTVSRSDDWTCKKSGSYKQKCVGKGAMKGRKKTVIIKKGYKKRYNKAYKAWRAKQKG